MRGRKLIILMLAAVLALTGGCSKTSQRIGMELALTKEKVMVFEDGGSVDEWNDSAGFFAAYKLADGTTLLLVDESSGPENVQVNGLEGMDALNDTARNAIGTFYEKQGLLYEIEEELDDAYAEYLECKEKKESYQEHYISQQTYPTASNDEIICYLTTLVSQADGLAADERYKTAIFKKNTGENISSWELFNMPSEDAMQSMLDAAAITEPALRAELEAALSSVQIIFYPENLELYFPQGTLSSQEDTFVIGLDYNANIQSIFNPWAILTPISE